MKHFEVQYLTDPELDPKFEQAYLKVREQEKRIYTDAEVQRLPYATDQNPHQREWSRRIPAMKRILSDFSLHQPLHVLDIGCGNGWFSAHLADQKGIAVDAIDLNSVELEQAGRAFHKNDLRFYYLDIFKDEPPRSSYDRIVLNSAVQYFKDFDALMSRLFQFLSDKGEVHLLDSPFYQPSELAAAQQRTQAYYAGLNAEDMGDNYFHRTWKELELYAHEVRYNPHSFGLKLKQKLFPSDSPFPWIVIRSTNRVS